MMLAGLRVIEMGQNVAGPHAAQILGDLGAEVIKVERPGGEEGRKLGPPFAGDDPAWFHQINRSKKSVVVDLNDEAARDRLVTLIGESDVFLHNMRPGVLAGFGLDAATLRARFPRLIYADIGAFGSAGPLAGRPGYELLMQAYGGLMSITGAPDAPPTRAGPSIVDLSTGMWTAIGILAAIVQRQASGCGSHIETSLFETALSLSGIHMVNYLASGAMPARSAAGFAGLAPYGGYKTADGDLILGAGNDRLFERLAELLGRPDWTTDPRFRTNVDRVAHRAEIEAELGAILIARPTAHWQALFDTAGIPCAPIRTIPQLVDDPQVQALGMVGRLGGLDGPHALSLPLSFDQARAGPLRPTPRAGEQNDDIFGLV